MKRSNKKGVSPVIATVLLIAIVIVIALLVFFWFRGLTEETVTKFGTKNIKLVCNDVRFEADFSNDVLTISNMGTVPIYNINVRVSSQYGFSTQNLKEFSESWPTTGLNQGEVFSENIQLMQGLTQADSLTLIPVLAGKSGNEETTYACEETQGHKITL